MLPLHYNRILGLETGVEPATSRLQGDRSANLSYTSMVAEVGFEPTT
jgi:hypothetical protein